MLFVRAGVIEFDGKRNTLLPMVNSFGRDETSQTKNRINHYTGFGKGCQLRYICITIYVDML